MSIVLLPTCGWCCDLFLRARRRQPGGRRGERTWSAVGSASLTAVTGRLRFSRATCALHPPAMEAFLHFRALLISERRLSYHCYAVFRLTFLCCMATAARAGDFHYAAGHFSSSTGEYIYYDYICPAFSGRVHFSFCVCSRSVLFKRAG